TALTADELDNYSYVEVEEGLRPVNTVLKPSERRVSLSDTSSMGVQNNFDFAFEFCGKGYRTTPGRHWSTTANGLRTLGNAGRLYPRGDRLFYKRYSDDFPVRPLANLWDDTQFGGFVREERKVYVVQTLALVIQRCLLMTTDPG